jgi:uncharacterized protein YcbX
MVADRHGRFTTQREHPRLALIDTTIVDGCVTLGAPDVGTIRLPPAALGEPSQDVTVWRSNVRGFDAGDAPARWISAFLGADLRIIRFDRSRQRMCNPDYAGDSGAHTMFADGYPLLLVGQASLDDLNARLTAKGASPLPMNRFRPNIVIAGLDPYAEDHLDSVESDGVTLRLVKPCVRCKVTTTDQATGHVEFEPLPTLSTYLRNDSFAGVTFGMNAVIVDGAGRTLAVDGAVNAEYRF